MKLGPSGTETKGVGGGRERPTNGPMDRSTWPAVPI